MTGSSLTSCRSPRASPPATCRSGRRSARRQVWEAIRQRDGAFGTGHTFTGHTAACAAGVAVQKIITREGLLDAGAKPTEARLKSCWRMLLRGVDAVGDIRGRGPFHLCRTGRRPRDQTPFDPGLKLFLKIRAAGHAKRPDLLSGRRQCRWHGGDIVILAPPYNCQRRRTDRDRRQDRPLDPRSPGGRAYRLTPSRGSRRAGWPLGQRRERKARRRRSAFFRSTGCHVGGSPPGHAGLMPQRARICAILAP